MPPIDSSTAQDRHRLVRVARVVRGSLPFTLTCRPRFDYGRASHTLTQADEHSALFHGPGTDLCLQSTTGVPFRADGNDVTARFTLSAGQAAAVVMTSSASGGTTPPPPSLEAIADDFERCRAFWLSWLRSCTYRGRWQDIVNRSAITLKLLTYAPTGAPIAATTMGLPEQIGGERNWDYRYTWIRDAALSVRPGRSLRADRRARLAREAAGLRAALRHRRPGRLPSFPEQQQGEISGLSRSVSNLGSSFGTAIAGTILVSGLTKGAYAAAMIVLAVIGLGGLAAASLLPRETGPSPAHVPRSTAP
jgi:hypothetical protein